MFDIKGLNFARILEVRNNRGSIISQQIYGNGAIVLNRANFERIIVDNCLGFNFKIDPKAPINFGANIITTRPANDNTQFNPQQLEVYNWLLNGSGTIKIAVLTKQGNDTYQMNMIVTPSLPENESDSWHVLLDEKNYQRITKELQKENFGYIYCDPKLPELWGENVMVKDYNTNWDKATQSWIENDQQIIVPLTIQAQSLFDKYNYTGYQWNKLTKAQQTKLTAYLDALSAIIDGTDTTSTELPTAPF